MTKMTDCNKCASGMNTEWLNILSNPELHSESEKQNALSYVRCNFMSVIKNDDFLGLNIHIFVELLSSDDLIVDNEISVYVSIRRWIEHHLKNPSEVLYELLKAVRLIFVPDEYLIEVVIPYLSKYEGSQSFISEALHWKLSTARKIDTERTKPRKNACEISKCMLVVGSGDFNTSKTVEIYDSSKTWRRLKDLNISVRNFGAAILEDKLIIAGGYNGNSVKDVFEVDIETGNMKALSPMNEIRHNIELVVVKGEQSSKLYIFGGAGDSIKPLKTAEVYDTKTKQWTYISPMPVSRDGCGAALHGSRIYVMGGYDEESARAINRMDVYETREDKWYTKAPMNQPRVYCNATVLGNFLYVLASYDRKGWAIGLSSVEKYDIIKNTWTTVANVSSAGCVGPAIFDNSLISVGGINSTAVEKYDTEKNIWEKIEPLTLPRERVCTVPLPSKYNDMLINW